MKVLIFIGCGEFLDFFSFSLPEWLAESTPVPRNGADTGDSGNLK